MSGLQLSTILAKRDAIDGDDALLRLAQSKLFDAGLGGEVHPDSPEHLAELVGFLPGHAPSTVHLPREIDVLDEDGRGLIQRYASIFGDAFYGLILHDDMAAAVDMQEYIAAVQDLDTRLQDIDGAPWVFLEYAAGLSLDEYGTLMESLAECKRISACIDVGHIGINACRTLYAEQFPDSDICHLNPNSPDLPPRIGTIQRVVAKALPATLSVIERIGAIGKPVHFHLHDAHPLSTLSLYGVSDHLSFLQEIELPFEYEGRRRISGMYGPTGLCAIIQKARAVIGEEKATFMLEIHPQERRTPLGAKEEIFDYWLDKTNAERMNGWLDMLLENAMLLRAIGSCG